VSFLTLRSRFFNWLFNLFLFVFFLILLPYLLISLFLLLLINHLILEIPLILLLLSYQHSAIILIINFLLDLFLLLLSLLFDLVLEPLYVCCLLHFCLSRLVAQSVRTSQYRGGFFRWWFGLLLLQCFNQCEVIVLVFFHLLISLGMLWGFVGMFWVFNFVCDDRVHKGQEATCLLGLFTTHYYINIKIINMWRSLLK
jgi:hypothetical protein